MNLYHGKEFLKETFDKLGDTEITAFFEETKEKYFDVPCNQFLMAVHCLLLTQQKELLQELLAGAIIQEEPEKTEDHVTDASKKVKKANVKEKLTVEEEPKRKRFKSVKKKKWD